MTSEIGRKPVCVGPSLSTSQSIGQPSGLGQYIRKIIISIGAQKPDGARGYCTEQCNLRGDPTALLRPGLKASRGVESPLSFIIITIARLIRVTLINKN